MNIWQLFNLAGNAPAAFPVLPVCSSSFGVLREVENTRVPAQQQQIAIRQARAQRYIHTIVGGNNNNNKNIQKKKRKEKLDMCSSLPNQTRTWHTTKKKLVPSSNAQIPVYIYSLYIYRLGCPHISPVARARCITRQSDAGSRWKLKRQPKSEFFFVLFFFRVFRPWRVASVGGNEWIFNAVFASGARVFIYTFSTLKCRLSFVFFFILF